MERRAAVAALGAAALSAQTRAWTRRDTLEPGRLRGRLKQSVCRWPFHALALDELCRRAADLGLAGIDLLGSEDWERVRERGLICSMGYPAIRPDFITKGFNDAANHAQLLGELEDAIPRAARARVPNLIAMFGNRAGQSDAQAVETCAAGLRQIRALAEEHQVTLCLELLNSTVDHPGYQGDHTAFGVAVVRAVGSVRVKLLYDVYHMQIMEGDIIRTIRNGADAIAHFHTGGVPGRHELDHSQELDWRGIAAAIADTGFAGYLAHEFVPTRDPIRALGDAVETCTV